MANGGCIPTVRIVVGEKWRVIEPSCGELLRFRQQPANKANDYHAVTHSVNLNYTKHTRTSSARSYNNKGNINIPIHVFLHVCTCHSRQLIQQGYKYKLGTCVNSIERYLIKITTSCYCRGGTG